MKILVSNDDGINSLGLKSIVERLRADNHQVYVIAPDSNRSAVSNHLTMNTDCFIKKIDDNDYEHSGYPSDCVFTGLTSNLLGEIDLIISGINKGGNMGTDIVYSGTCAVARQGVLLGIPSIALSVEPVVRNQKSDEYKYKALADFTAKNLHELIKIAKTDFPQAFVNINGLSVDSYKGVRFADKLNYRFYGDSVKVENHHDNVYTSRFVYGKGDFDISAEKGSDLDYCRQGYISIAKVFANPECDECIDCMNFSL